MSVCQFVCDESGQVVNV